MIETKKEWKRAFKGILIFIGSAFVLLSVIAILRPSSDDFEATSSIQEEKKKKQPIYSSKEQFSDFMAYYMIPIIDKESETVNAYNDAFNEDKDTSLEDPMLDLFLTISIFEKHSGVTYLNLSIDSAEKTQEIINRVERIPTPKNFNEYHANEFESMLASYKDYLVIRKSLYEQRITFIQDYQNSGLTFYDFVFYSEQPTPVFNDFIQQKTSLNKDLLEAQDEYLKSIYSLAGKFDYDLTNVFGASEFPSTPL